VCTMIAWYRRMIIARDRSTEHVKNGGLSWHGAVAFLAITRWLLIDV